jgi:hypothetical protein
VSRAPEPGGQQDRPPARPVVLRTVDGHPDRLPAHTAAPRHVACTNCGGPMAAEPDPDGTGDRYRCSVCGEGYFFSY